MLLFFFCLQDLSQVHFNGTTQEQNYSGAAMTQVGLGAHATVWLIVYSLLSMCTVGNASMQQLIAAFTHSSSIFFFFPSFSGKRQ